MPPLGNRIFVEFSHFELEHSWSTDPDDKSSKCLFDKLTIEEREQGSETALRTDEYCENMPKSINTTNTVVIKYEQEHLSGVKSDEYSYIIF